MKKSVLKYIGIIAVISGLLMYAISFILTFVVDAAFYSNLQVLSRFGSSSLGLGLFLWLFKGNLFSWLHFAPITRIPGLVENEELEQIAQENYTEDTDERGQAIHEKAGWVTFLVLFGMLMFGFELSAALSAGDIFRPWSFYAMTLFLGVELIAVIVYSIARAYWNKRM